MKTRNNIYSAFLIILVISSCNDSEQKYNSENKQNANGVDYSIRLHLMPLMSVYHEKSFELYYTINVPVDTIDVEEIMVIDKYIDAITDSLWKKNYESGSIVVIKETLYTNKLRAKQQISDSMNPFEGNNIYLVEYAFENKTLFSKRTNRKNKMFYQNKYQ
jgi:hypothetical protein